MKLQKNAGQLFRRQIEMLNQEGRGTVGDSFNLEFVSADWETGEFVLRAATEPWMRNLNGTLHGGMAATLLDQSMGCAARCVGPNGGSIATVQLQITYHRPVKPEQSLLVKVRLLTVTKSLRNLYAEIYQESDPDRVSVSGAATFFYKPGETARVKEIQKK